MLQNRVDPFGNIISTSARGAWLGNRGQLHGNGKTILRPFKHKAWIICELAFKNRHRAVMSPGLWTELFFLDEATAFAAGHRPCFECRREDAKRFKEAWIKGNPAYGYSMKTSIMQIDDILQEERIEKQFNKVTFTSPLKNVPQGAFIRIEKQPYLVSGNKLLLWTPFGYEEGVVKVGSEVEVLTPRSIFHAFRAGYYPEINA